MVEKILTFSYVFYIWQSENFTITIFEVCLKKKTTKSSTYIPKILKK